MVWCGISFILLLWATFFGGMAHAQLLSLPNAHLLSLMHRETLAGTYRYLVARMKAFHPEAKHLWGARLDKENPVLRSCCPFDSTLFVLIHGWRKWCNYFFLIPSSWTGETTEWLCKPLNYEIKLSWQQSVLRNCSLAPLSPGSPLFFCIRTDWAGATVFQCSDPEGLLVLVCAFQETNCCAW